MKKDDKQDEEKEYHIPARLCTIEDFNKNEEY